MIILFWSSIPLLITAFKHHLQCFRALRFTSKMHSMCLHTYRWCKQMFISIVDISISQQSSCLYSCRLLILNCPIQSSWLWLMQILDLKVTRLKVMSLLSLAIFKDQIYNVLDVSSNKFTACGDKGMCAGRFICYCLLELPWTNQNVLISWGSVDNQNNPPRLQI